MDYDFLTRYFREFEHFSLASAFGVVNSLIRPAKDSIWFYLIEFVISVTVATLTGFIATDLGFSKALSYSFTAISALLARDMLTLIIGFGDYVTGHKETLFSKLFNKAIGKLQVPQKEDIDGKE